MKTYLRCKWRNEVVQGKILTSQLTSDVTESLSFSAPWFPHVGSGPQGHLTEASEFIRMDRTLLLTSGGRRAPCRTRDALGSSFLHGAEHTRPGGHDVVVKARVSRWLWPPEGNASCQVLSARES